LQTRSLMRYDNLIFFLRMTSHNFSLQRPRVSNTHYSDIRVPCSRSLFPQHSTLGASCFVQGSCTARIVCAQWVRRDTLTTSLVIAIPSSSSWNEHTTTTLTTKDLCPGGCVVWTGPKFFRPHSWGSLIDWLIAFITWNSNLVPLLEGLWSLNTCRFDFSVFGIFDWW